MTDKEQIINSCKLYKDGLCISPLGNEVKCEDISVDKCYFKQKIFAEQERDRKTQECEELKEKLYQIEDVVKPINEQLPEDSVIRQIMLILNDCNKLEPSRYRKALEEIEEEITVLHYIAIPFHRGITHELADIVQEYKNKILDIINKAKGLQ